MKKIKRQALIFCLALTCSAMLLQGCGDKSSKKDSAVSENSQKTTNGDEASKDYLSDMKEFSTTDKTVSIYFDQDWQTEDLEMDFWLGAGNKKGDKAAAILQFPKNGANMMANSIEMVAEMVEASYNVSDKESTTAPSVPGMSEITAYTCKMTAGGVTGGAYLIYGETSYAYYALTYIADKLTDEDIASFNASCSKFQENPPEVEDNFSSEMTDTLRWFNAAYAVLIDLNGRDFNLFGGIPANDDSKTIMQAGLADSWGVEDRTSADENIDWILSEGHRVDFAENMKALEDAGVTADTSTEDLAALLKDEYDFEDETANSFARAFGVYTEHGADAIAAWDYSRAMYLLSAYYHAGYYTEQEALDKSLEVAQTIQSMYESWDDFMDSYLWGYDYWAEEESTERREIYNKLKAQSNSPFRFDFKMNLEKTW
ncbi:MAG: DUF1266 domain-containing protein [Lachnospiraceae bacterium]|nr:DUF1266 domain-containing protein [Lachnospiraceae bacterium]